MKVYLIFIVSLLLFLYKCTICSKKPTEFVIITASYNNEEWCTKNLLSIFKQRYSQWRLIYINDCSTDKTQEMVTALIDAYHLWHKVTLINNDQRRGHLYNQYHAIHTCANHEVIVNVDGDDWFSNSDVLSYLDTLYSQGNIWLTYGQFWYWKRNSPGCSRPLPQEVLEQNTIRDYPAWVTSHLRTFYAGLYKLIRPESLLYRGNFFPMAADVATMLPMIEMASKHTQFIAKILYIYNDNNSLSFYHTHEELQRKIHRYIRSLSRYQPLPEALFL